MMSRSPQLLYHNARAIPYPTTANNGNTLLAVRFASPVRVSSIRIAPEGVQSVEGIGVTYPSEWTGKVYFNLSDARPVNALASSEISFEELEWEQDYPVDMPEGVTTRLVLIASPAERLTISIYGHLSILSAPSDKPQDLEIYNAESQQRASPSRSGTDRSVFPWAADGPQGLVEMLCPSTPPTMADEAIRCLDLLSASDDSVRDMLKDNRSAMSFLTSSTSDSARRFLSKLEIPRPVAQGDSLSLEEAWMDLSSESLRTIAASEPSLDELLETPRGHEHSNFSRLLAAAATCTVSRDTNSDECLELILDILSGVPADPLLQTHLVKMLPRLYVISRLRGSGRALPLDTSSARPVLKSLAELSTQVMDGKSCWQVCKDLAQPFLGSLDSEDPVRALFDPVSIDAYEDSPHLVRPIDEDSRRLDRLNTAITRSNPDGTAPATGWVHQASAAELISLVAPRLYTTLQTSPNPPLGIPPVSQTSLDQGQAQASAFAGKVYSLHEFRKDRGDTGGGGLGVGTGGGGRPASRHVDDFAMAT